MNNNTSNNNYYPKLRFKGFDKNPCIITKLFEISTFTKGNGFSKKDIDLNGKYKLILYGDLFTCYKTIISNINNSTNKKGKILSEKNSILFPSSSTSNSDFFPCSSLDIEDILIGSDINYFILEKKFDSKYIAYLFSKEKHLKELFKLSEGSTVNHLYGEYIGNYQINITKNINEQQKIAHFMSLLDKQIDLYVRKLQLLEVLRKNILKIMDKSLIKNGQKIKLNNILESRKIEAINSLNGYTPISIMLNGLGFKKNNLQVKLSKSGRKYYERISGDLIIGLQNFHNGSIAILDDSFKKPIMSNAIASFINKSEYDLKLIKEILLSPRHQWYLKNIAEGTGQKEFTINKILNSYITISNNKFVKFIMKLLEENDLFISLIEQKIKILNKQKKYYLNNLFI